MTSVVPENELLGLTLAGGVAVIRLTRPPVNAMSFALQGQLSSVAETVAHDDDVRVVVLHGGERMFSAGADIKEMAASGHPEMIQRARRLQRAFNAVAEIPKPVIAAVEGPALGGGCELALCADFRICARDSQVGLPEILLGLIPGAGGTQRLARLVGPSRAKELIMTGRAVEADEALSIGLVDKVADTGEVFRAAMDWAVRLAAGPRYALRAAKEAIDRGLETNLSAGLEIERALFAGLFATDDASVGLRSFCSNGPGKARFD
ncbi:enoyl-CoA hydratase/isomerase family protein [Amycolatopsis benzoatilytica]|uniref:enoyl-CoA hydratase/isomerase family protein n=1 Tax=Amycolatopsis benzoatilytica TaxID=346045 RepID=UPI00037A443D|nr:enoyl-CoA hydratase-related protein [Amycolatopsis benzoatilytica]